jgi:hypothetical protein
MRKIILIQLCVFMFSFSISAQLYVDAESASINSNGDLIDNGRTLFIAKQGDSISNPFISMVNRTGGHSVAYQILGASTGSTSQRVESGIISGNDPPLDLSDGTVRYTGFSFQLAADVWSWPTDWFVIHQIQQSFNSGQTNNWPIVELNILGTTLAIRGAYGADGNQALTITRDCTTLKQSIWYDVVVGWKYSPNSTAGWINLWIKTSADSTYTQYSLTGIKLGYNQAPSKLFQNKFGIYRSRVNASNKIYFDEVRWGENFDDVKFPGSITGLDTPFEAITTKGYIRLSPNPVAANGILSIDFNPKANEHIMLSVVNSIGRQVAIKDLGIFQEGNTNFKLAVRSMNIISRGIYFLKISGETERTEKLIVY